MTSSFPSQHFTLAWYAWSFCRGFIVLYPVYSVLMLDRGLTPDELSTLFIIWAGAAMLLEVPSGVLGDLLPRPILMGVGMVLKAACFGIWWMIPTFGGYACGFLLWALSGALLSGAQEAFLFDSLKSADRSAEFTRTYARGASIEQTGLLLSLPVGGLLADWDTGLLHAVSMAVPLVGVLIIAVFFRGAPRASEARGGQGEAPFLDAMREGLQRSLASGSVLLIIAVFAVLNLVPEALDEYMPPLLDENEARRRSVLGMLLAVTTIGQVIGTALAGEFSTQSVKRVLLLYVLIGALLVPIGFSPDIMWVVLACTLAWSLHGAATVMLGSALQHAIDDRGRATVTSLAAFAQSALALPFYLTCGAIATSHGWGVTFSAAGIFTFATALLLLFAARAAIDVRATRDR